MDAMRWSDAFSVGSPDLDREHRALFRIVTELELAVNAASEPAMQAGLERLIAYSDFHFRSEESIMRAKKFPGIDAHAHEHRKFATRLQLFRYQPNTRE